jgi:hypothetical protein
MPPFGALNTARTRRSSHRLPGRLLCIPLLLCISAAYSAVAASLPLTDTVSSLRPTWTIGDWWVVESQVYDHGDKKPGAVPGWLDKETWLFSVIATNSIDGQSCYEVSIKPGDGNRCPYWFSCWFRISDLLVMRRELHQPTITRTGRPFSAPAAQADYSKDEESPFLPSDFPNLPLTTPHFAGGQTNRYAPQASPSRPASAPQGVPRKSPRSLSGSVTQAFQPNESMEQENAHRPGAAMPPNSPGAKVRFGVILLAQSADKYERQSWHSDLPWHVYGEKSEHGVAVRRSWLADHGHASAPVNPVQGGAK